MSFKEAMSLTMPQLILLNAGAKTNRERADARYEVKKKQGERKKKRDEEDPVVWNGKRLSEMTTMELVAYYGDFQS